ncbi:MAG TPA: LamG-like jellyroll fold domain-containing protein [Ktedonobacteraceae bacterium]|nr:LamG-like jellyroll fold domain-containing protein [Ktedonobacteraceae bacterium]
MKANIINDTCRKGFRYQLWLACLLCSILIGCGVASPSVLARSGTIFPSSCAVKLPASVGYWPMNTNAFQGVFQFTGQANTKNAGNPSIGGANLEWSWADIEQVEGQYNWSKVDRDIGLWTSQGKQVILRFATAGQLSWSGSVDGSYTPPWVFDTYGVPRVTEINGTVFPLYWNPIYLQKLADFVRTAAARYDTNPYVAAVQIGIGQGGETEPDGSASQNPHQLQLWQRYGYTNALWWDTIKRIVAIYEAAWTHTPLALMTTSTFLKYDDKYFNRTLVERYAVQQGLWLQINSLDDAMPTSLLADGVNHLTTTVEEQRQSAQQSGYPAIHDVKHAIALGARYALVFASDLANPSNADALAYAQQQITAPVMQDCSGKNLALSVVGRVTPVPGSSGKPDTYAQLFDGATGSASAGQSPLQSVATWTLDVWLNPTTLPQTEAIAVMDGAESGGIGLGIAAGAQGGSGSELVAYFPGVGWVDSGYAFPAPRQWYHVVVTRDGTTVRFYVNGAQTSATSALSPLTVASHFSAGSGFDLSTNAPTHFFTGAIDDVAVYASALGPAKVRAHMNDQPL